jgi:hypothetical protein
MSCMPENNNASVTNGFPSNTGYSGIPGLELEFVLRPTVSRPVRLGIVLPFGTHDQILYFSFLFFV